MYILRKTGQNSVTNIEITWFAPFSPLLLPHLHLQIIHDIRPDFSLCREAQKSSNHQKKVWRSFTKFVPFRLLLLFYTFPFLSVYPFNIYKHGWCWSKTGFTTTAWYLRFFLFHSSFILRTFHRRRMYQVISVLINVFQFAHSPSQSRQKVWL